MPDQDIATPLPPTDGTPAEQDLAALPEWAQKRLKAVNDESAARRVKLKEQEERIKALEQDRQQRLTVEEKLREAEANAVGLMQYKDRAAALEAMIQAQNNAAIANIPEDMRGLIPTDYTPERLASWLTANAGKLSRPKAPSLDGGAGVGDRGQDEAVLTDDERAMARRFGLTEKQVLAAKHKNK